MVALGALTWSETLHLSSKAVAAEAGWRFKMINGEKIWTEVRIPTVHPTIPKEQEEVLEKLKGKCSNPIIKINCI